jgi:transcriptional regulator with XRE-family HTH domain
MKDNNKEKNIDQHIANRIKQLRKIKKITQAEIAKKIGISTRYYQSLESGVRELKLGTIHRIAKILHISPAIFLKSEEIFQLSAVLKLESSFQVFQFFNVAIGFTDTNGQFLYQNKFFLERYRPGNKTHDQPIYPWDYLVNRQADAVHREILKNIIDLRPEINPYFGKYHLANGNETHVRIDWNYIEKNKSVTGFVLIILEDSHWHCTH